MRAFEYPTASRRTVANLKNWIEGKGSIARRETDYLEYGDDLLNLTAPRDEAVTWLEELIYKCGVGFLRGRIPRSTHSRDPAVHIFKAPLVSRIVKVLAAFLISSLLLLPVIVCHLMTSATAKLAIVTLSTTCFVAALASFANARTIELIVSGATLVHPRLSMSQEVSSAKVAEVHDGLGRFYFGGLTFCNKKKRGGNNSTKCRLNAIVNIRSP